MYDELEEQLQELIDNGLLIVWDEDTRGLKSVVSISVNGNCLQLNTENWEEDDAV